MRGIISEWCSSPGQGQDRFETGILEVAYQAGPEGLPAGSIRAGRVPDRELLRRTLLLFLNLPLEKLDRMALKAKLDEIGKIRSEVRARNTGSRRSGPQAAP